MTKRVVTQWTVAFLLGIAGSYYKNAVVYSVAVLYILWMGICFWKKQKWIVLLSVLLCMLFFLLGFARREKQQDLIRNVEEYLEENSDVYVVGTIYKKEEKNNKINYYLKDSCIIHKKDIISCNHILVYLNSDEYSIGDIIEVEGIGECFRQARNEGNYDEEKNFYSKDILFRVEAKRTDLRKKIQFAWQESLYQLRKRIQQVYIRHLPKSEAGVLGVMSLGEKEILDAEVKTLYQQSGISHLLAISGLHISIVGMGVYRFLRKRGLSYLVASGVAGLLIIGFGQLSGMEISTTRAVFMFLIMLLGNVLGMSYDSVTALSVAAIFQLWDNPGSLWNAGFLFSYSAVLAVVVVVNIWKRFWGGGRKRTDNKNSVKKERIWHRGIAMIGNTMLLNGGIQLVTLPLSVYFYYEFPLYSILINGLLLPFMGVVLMSGLLGGLLGLFHPVAAEILLKPAYYLLNWNSRVCEFFQKFPKATWITGQPQLGNVIFYYSILIVVSYIMYRWWKKEEQMRDKEAAVCRKGEKAVISIIPVIALGFLLFARSGNENQICFLDVGQGDGIFLQSKEGAAFFVDGGSTSESQVGKYRILSFLKYRGISHIDGWFVSHGDQDHISGLEELWEEGYQIDTLFLADGIVKDEAYTKLCERAAEHGTKLQYLKPGQVVGTQSMTLTCLYPWEEGRERNASSMVLKMEMQGMSGLLAGDIGREQEMELLQENDNLSVDIYKASHHGSNGSNSQAFLNQLKPTVTVVSCGEENSYGHPGVEAVKRMEVVGSKIFYTMKSGQITIGCAEGRIWVKEYKKFSK